MTEKRLKEIETEAKRRLQLWLTYSDFETMTCEGSYIRFNMALGLNGYPFILEPWMDESFKKPFVNVIEWYTDEYDDIMYNLFLTAQKL
jgi:hypothetical protein